MHKLMRRLAVIGSVTLAATVAGSAAAHEFSAPHDDRRRIRCLGLRP